jgi:argininosuccinate synthase
MPDRVVVTSRQLARATANPVHLDIGFEDGIPVSINGVSMSLTELMESLETITGEAALTVLDRQFA